MISRNQTTCLILFVTIFAMLSSYIQAVPTNHVSLIKAIHQIKAQLHDLSPEQQDRVIAQVKQHARNKARMVNQAKVTSYIEQAQKKFGPYISAAHKQTTNHDDNYQQNLMRAIEASKHDAYARIFSEHPVYGLIVRKIDALRTLPLTQLCAYNETNPQKSGGQSIRNAWAIASLIEDNRPITAENIQERAATRPDIIEEVDGDLASLMTRAELLNLSSAYLVECTENRLTGYYISPEQTLIPFSNLHVNQLLRTYRDLDRWAISFICKLGAQHFLVSLVKQSGKNPELFYLDPQNRQLEHNSYIHRCVQEIHRMCLEQSRLTRILNNLQQTFVQPIFNAVRRVAQWVMNLF